MMDNLVQLCNSNRDYFAKDKTENSQKLCANFMKITEVLKSSETIIKRIETFAPDFDFDENTPGNGYRSFIFVFNAALKYTETHCKYIADNRGKFLFRKSVNAK
jgi:hormone-sensitive lipase